MTALLIFIVGVMVGCGLVLGAALVALHALSRELDRVEREEIA